MLSSIRPEMNSEALQLSLHLFYIINSNKWKDYDRFYLLIMYYCITTISDSTTNRPHNMKQFIFAVFMLGLALQAPAQLKEKHVIGTWSYLVTTDQGALTGKLIFEKKDDQLAGEVQADDGNLYSLTKVEIRDNNVLYFELQPDYDLLKVTLTMDKEKYTGTVGNIEGELPITGEKLD